MHQKASGRPRAVYLSRRKVADSFRCVNCGHLLNICTGLATRPDHAMPCTGDLSICVYCGCLLEFCDGHFRAGTAEKLQEIPAWMQEKIIRVMGRPILIMDQAV